MLELLYRSKNHLMHTDLLLHLNHYIHRIHLQCQYLNMIEIQYHHQRLHKQHQYLPLLLLLHMFFLLFHHRKNYLHYKTPSLTMNQHSQQDINLHYTLESAYHHQQPHKQYLYLPLLLLLYI